MGDRGRVECGARQGGRCREREGEEWSHRERNKVKETKKDGEESRGVLFSL